MRPGCAGGRDARPARAGGSGGKGAEGRGHPDRTRSVRGAVSQALAETWRDRPGAGGKAAARPLPAWEPGFPSARVRGLVVLREGSVSPRRGRDPRPRSSAERSGGEPGPEASPVTIANCLGIDASDHRAMPPADAGRLRGPATLGAKVRGLTAARAPGLPRFRPHPRPATLRCASPLRKRKAGRSPSRCPALAPSPPRLADGASSVACATEAG